MFIKNKHFSNPLQLDKPIMTFITPFFYQTDFELSAIAKKEPVMEEI